MLMKKSQLSSNSRKVSDVNVETEKIDKNRQHKDCFELWTDEKLLRDMMF